jgi:hypothetical protein
MVYPKIIKIIDKGLYSTCEACGNDKEFVSKVRVKIYGKIELWFVCHDCWLDIFGG